MARWKSSPPARTAPAPAPASTPSITPADQKVILRGPWVRMVEKLFTSTQPNTTEGKEAIYFANDDRLLVTGEPAKPGNSRINRKKGK